MRIRVTVPSANGEERVKVEALDAGADDHVTKPFDVDELPAPVMVVLRRCRRRRRTPFAQPRIQFFRPPLPILFTV
jgi:DNA-binding response OmpR family regulator